MKDVAWTTHMFPNQRGGFTFVVELRAETTDRNLNDWVRMMAYEMANIPEEYLKGRIVMVRELVNSGAWRVELKSAEAFDVSEMTNFLLSQVLGLDTYYGQ